MIKNLRKFLVLLVCALSLLVNFAYANGIEIGEKAADFTLGNGLTGEEVNLTNNIVGKAKLTAIIFANSSCGACRKELETLSELSAKNHDLVTYVVLVDMNGAEIVKTFAERFKFNVTYLLDSEFSIPPAYDFYFTPSLIIIDQKGVILFKKGGYNIKNDDKLIKDKIDELLKK